LQILYHAANEPDILQEAEKRQSRILDADYRKIVDSSNSQHCLEAKYQTWNVIID
jgi:hypothetical protein